MSQETIERFKEFVKTHPGLIKEVRNGQRTWQDVYEEWYILGDESDIWNQYKKKSDGGVESSWLPEIMEKLKHVDLDDVQKKIADMRGLVSNIQQLVGDFKPKQKTPSPPPPRYPYHYY